MSLVAELMKKLAERATEDSRRIIAEAEKEAKKILEEAERKAKAAAEERLKEVERQLAERKAREMRRAEMEAKRLLREARLVQMRVIEKAFAEARKKLEEAVGKGGRKYTDLLVKLTLEAVKNLEGDELVIMASERDKELVEKKVIPKVQREAKSSLGRSVKLKPDNSPIETMGGVIVRTADGKLYYNNTLEARLERVKSERLLELMQIVSGGKR